MIKRLTRSLLFIVLLIIPIFGRADAWQERQIIAKFQKTQVQILITIPRRNGYSSAQVGSGTVIAKTTNKNTEAVIYYIYTNPHLISDIELVLTEYKKAGIKIYILGKNNTQAAAEIVALDWEVEGLLLKSVIPKDQLDNFNFQVATISNRLPISSEEEKFSDDKLADIVYLGGYPHLEMADSEAKVSRYIENETIKTATYSFAFLKTMHVPAKGLVGPGQSGGGIFMVNDKTGEPEWVGTTALNLSETTLMIGIPIDVIVESFLKKLPQLKGLIDFPDFN